MGQDGTLLATEEGGGLVGVFAYCPSAQKEGRGAIWCLVNFVVVNSIAFGSAPRREADSQPMGEPLHCTRTARYFLDQVPLEESPSTPLPNTLISPLP